MKKTKKDLVVWTLLGTGFIFLFAGAFTKLYRPGTGIAVALSLWIAAMFVMRFWKREM